MNIKTRFIYKSSSGEIEFSRGSDFWISELEGVSSVEVDIATSRGNRQVGSTVSAQSIKPRTITVNGSIFEPVNANRKKLIEVIAPQDPATLIMIDGNESWFIDVLPLKTPEIQEGDSMVYFQMQLFASYPYWKTAATSSAQVAGIKKMFKFPFFTGGNWYLSQFSGDYYTTVNNNGNVPIDVQVVFTSRAEVLNPQIFHVDTQKMLRIKHKLIPGELITVSTVYGEKGVSLQKTDGTIDKSLRYLSFDSDLSFQLVPGDNLIRTDADSGRSALSVRINSWEGVKSGV